MQVLSNDRVLQLSSNDQVSSNDQDDDRVLRLCSNDQVLSNAPINVEPLPPPHPQYVWGEA